nr:uncharacterized protein LOC128674887 [Plodia interpunctella]
MIALEIVPEKPEIIYTNPKYIKDLKFTVHRKGRGSPYYIDFYVESLTGCGDNLTVNLKIYEYIGGNYVPLGIQGNFTLCDFLANEPYLGKMFMNQVQKQNYTCPFRPGVYEFNDLLFHLEDFPFNIPFTWSSITVRTMSELIAHHTDTKEPIFRYKFHFIVHQKPKNKS